LVAGGKVKKSKRTAPKSDDIYLKLLVKVSIISLCVYIIYMCICGFRNLLNDSCGVRSAVPVSGTENRKQLQRGDSEAAFHEQDQQPAIVDLEANQVLARKGLFSFFIFYLLFLD
jgi:hypothetical protein